ncbi:MAG: Uma2 family endonuclease [Spirochaetaceae bacterium]|nr:Uma2 family endonuclease [Spirochaetaceae bacterium]
MSEILNPQYYTVEDYYNLPESILRCELDEGILLMSPSPSGMHQQIYGSLYRQLAGYFDDKNCLVFQDFDVLLFENESIIYRPDLLVLCDLSKYSEQCIVGAPDFIIEVGSPGTIKNDFGKKRLNYERAGVKEYWVVRNPYLVHVYLLNDEGYYTETVHRNQTMVKATIFHNLTLDFTKLQRLVLSL